MSEEAPKSEQEIEKLSAIRDIIFGNEIKEYNQEFSELKKIIDTNKAESNKKDDDLQNDLDKKIDDLSAKMDSKIQELDKKLSASIAALAEEKTDRKQLGDLLEKIGKELKS